MNFCFSSRLDLLIRDSCLLHSYKRGRYNVKFFLIMTCSTYSLYVYRVPMHLITLNHTNTNTIGRIPLDEGSSSCRD